VLYYIDVAVLGVSFEAVHDEIDSWCFLAAISKFFNQQHLVRARSKCTSANMKL